MRVKRDYMAMLLRLWRDRPGSVWRAAIENPHSGERIAFATAAEFITYLEETMGLTRDKEEPDHGTHQ